MDLKKLSALFPENDIEWRVGQSGVSKTNGRVWAMCLAYITNRAIMERLDEVVGPHLWKNEFIEWHGNSQLCGISIKIGDEWITKWDGADNTNIEGTKGGLSDSMKRAAVQWGIGRYLYNLPVTYAVIVDGKAKYSSKTKTNQWFNWNPPRLPEQFILKENE
jgi:hypothetical protein